MVLPYRATQVYARTYRTPHLPATTLRCWLTGGSFITSSYSPTPHRYGHSGTRRRRTAYFARLPRCPCLPYCCTALPPRYGATHTCARHSPHCLVAPLAGWRQEPRVGGTFSHAVGACACCHHHHHHPTTTLPPPPPATCTPPTAMAAARLRTCNLLPSPFLHPCTSTKRGAFSGVAPLPLRCRRIAYHTCLAISSNAVVRHGHLHFRGVDRRTKQCCFAMVSVTLGNGRRCAACSYRILLRPLPTPLPAGFSAGLRRSRADVLRRTLPVNRTDATHLPVALRLHLSRTATLHGRSAHYATRYAPATARAYTAYTLPTSHLLYRLYRPQPARRWWRCRRVPHSTNVAGLNIYATTRAGDIATFAVPLVADVALG